MKEQFVIVFILLSISYTTNAIPFIASSSTKESDHDSVDLQKSSLRVVNGIPVTNRNEYPFVVDLHMDEFAVSSSRFCTGTLIAEDLVLTAAHCVLNVGAANPVFATVGRIELQDDHQDNDKAKTFRTIASIAHPSYDGIGSPKDVALVLLNNTSTAPIVSLAESSPDVSQEAWVVGYGIKAIGTLEQTGRPIEVLSRRLQKTALKIMHNSFCDQPGSNVKTAPGLLCTAGVREGSSACKGDSGGGLFIQRTAHTGGAKDKKAKQKNVVLQVGIVSYGDAQCASEDGGVFTDVASVSEWIAAASQKLKQAFHPVSIAMDENKSQKVTHEGKTGIGGSVKPNLILAEDSQIKDGDEIKLYTLQTNFTRSRLLTVSLCDGPSGYTARLFVASDRNETRPDEGSCPDNKLSTLTLSAEQNSFVVGVSGRSDVPFRLSLSTEPEPTAGGNQGNQDCQHSQIGGIPPGMTTGALKRNPSVA